jgi:hypothetical protein
LFDVDFENIDCSDETKLSICAKVLGYIFFILPIALAFGFLASAIGVTFLLVPAILYQIWGIIKIIFRSVDFCCCLRCLPCFR